MKCIARMHFTASWSKRFWALIPTVLKSLTRSLRRDFKLILWSHSVIGWRCRTACLIGWERYLPSISLKTWVRVTNLTPSPSVFVRKRKFPTHKGFTTLVGPSLTLYSRKTLCGYLWIKVNAFYCEIDIYPLINKIKFLHKHDVYTNIILLMLI